MSALACLVFLLVLVACGPADEHAFSISTESLNFTSRVGDFNWPPPQNVQLEVLAETKVFFAVLFDDGPESPFERVTFAITGATTGQIRVEMKEAASLGPGHHPGNVVVAACHDEHCKSPLKNGTRVIAVTYDISPDLVTRPTALTFSQTQDISIPPAQSLIFERYDGNGYSYMSWNATLQYEGQGDWLQVSPMTGREPPATLQVAVKPLTQAGTYHATLHLAVNGNFDWVDVPITYTVEASPLTVRPASPSFILTPASTTAQLSQTVTVSGDGTPLTWNATVGAPWLQVSPASGSSVPAAQITVSLVPEQIAQMARGEYSTTLTFSYTGGAGPAKALRVPVTLRTEVPQIATVMPYVVRAHIAEEVTLHGSGFLHLPTQPPRVLFGTVPASGVTVLNDTEMRVTHPALPAGRYAVHLETAPNLHSSLAVLVVQDSLAYGQASLPSSGSKQQLLYDAERRSLYTANETAHTVERFTYSPVTQSWEVRSPLAVPDVRDITLTPEGSELIVLAGTQLSGVDPETFTVRWTVAIPGTSSDHPAQHIAAANDGRVIIMAEGLSFFDLATRKFGSLPSQFYGRVWSGLGASGDGSRVVIIQDDQSSVYTYVSSAGSVFTSSEPPRANFSVVLDRTGQRGVFGGGRVVGLFNGQYYSSARLPDGGASVLTPDGKGAWSYNFIQRRLGTFDLSVPPNSNGEYALVGSGLAVTLTGSSPMFMRLTPDATTLFYNDGDHVFVQPLPLP